MTGEGGLQTSDLLFRSCGSRGKRNKSVEMGSQGEVVQPIAFLQQELDLDL